MILNSRNENKNYRLDDKRLKLTPWSDFQYDFMSNKQSNTMVEIQEHMFYTNLPMYIFRYKLQYFSIFLL